MLEKLASKDPGLHANDDDEDETQKKKKKIGRRHLKVTILKLVGMMGEEKD